MKCVSSCFSCLCGARNSSRITPSDPIQVIQPNQDSYKSHKESGNGEETHRRGQGNGSVNPNFFMGDGDGDDDYDGADRTNVGESAEEDSSTLQVKALYIEVGKDRLLRVIHVPSIEQAESPFRKGSPKKEGDTPEKGGSEQGDSPPGEKAPAENKEGEDDEEEYWFTKWARKPRFRSIFAKNPDQRPKIVNENNNQVNNEDGGKLSVEMEMARAAAAAKRRAWAYHNNGNRGEPAITQEPTINPNDEEEFNSIAIINSVKQQWSKRVSESEEEDEPEEQSPPPPYNRSPKKVEMEVSVERHNSSDRSGSFKEGVTNPAFQDDEDDDPEEEKEQEKKVSKTEEDDQDDDDDDEQNKSKASDGSSPSGQSTASVKSSVASPNKMTLEEDAIISEGMDDGVGSSKSSVATASPSSNGTGQKDPAGNLLNSTAKKPLIFLIHSISGSSDVWMKQMEFFQQLGYEVVAPDLLGHGLSSTPLNPKYYFFESLVQDLILIFDHFTKEDVKVVLIGHGYGACLAAMLTRVRLKSIALLITIAGGGPTPLVRRTCCQDSWFSWKCKLFHSNRIRGRFDNPELKHVLPPNIYKNILSGQVWGDGDSAFYRRVTVPTLLVYGMRDKVVTLVEECEMERTIPKSFLELIDSAGHMVMLDEPEKLNKMLCKFIQSWS